MGHGINVPQTKRTNFRFDRSLSQSQNYKKIILQDIYGMLKLLLTPLNKISFVGLNHLSTGRPSCLCEDAIEWSACDVSSYT